MLAFVVYWCLRNSVAIVLFFNFYLLDLGDCMLMPFLWFCFIGLFLLV